MKGYQTKINKRKKQLLTKLKVKIKVRLNKTQ